MNVNMYLAFFKWAFMKMFSGCFNQAADFRYELKKGGHNMALAIVAYIILSVVFFMFSSLLTIWLVPDRATVGLMVSGYLCAIAFTFVYNVVKAAFECFLEEREELFDTLKKDYP